MRTENDEYDRFPIAKRGYDPNAVEAYLDIAAAENDRMLNEAATRIASLELQLEEAKKLEEAVHLTIVAATKAKDDMIEAAKHQAAELAASGRKEGDRIVTDARMQAFQLVTGARKEAETIVGEARAEAAAVARVEGVAAATDDGPSKREVALQQRIEEMQQAIAAMELELSGRPARIDMRTAGTTAPVDEEAASEAPAVAATPDVAATVAATVASSTPHAASSNDDDTDIAIVVTDEPTIDAVIEIADDETEITLTEDDSVLQPVGARSMAELELETEIDPGDARAAAVRRSFYSRRSANLPHLGAEAGRGAMAAIAGLRTNFVAAVAEDDIDPEQAPAFKAV